jgi:hypothetical protein
MCGAAVGLRRSALINYYVQGGRAGRIRRPCAGTWRALHRVAFDADLCAGRQVYRVRGLDDGMGTRFLRLFETSLGSSAVLARTIHGDAHGAPPGLNTQERLMSPARLYYTT